MRRMICLLSVLLFAFSATSHASKIRRITLSELQAKADLIVMAKVTDVVAEKDIDHVTIKVDSYLKGKASQTDYTFTLVTRGGLKDFDPALKVGNSGVFFLKFGRQEGRVEKAYWGSVATFPQDHFDLTKKKAGPAKSDAGSLPQLQRMVASVPKMLEAKQHAQVVQTLFRLTKQDEIDAAVEHLRRPRCLEMYEKMFAVIAKLEPTSGKSPQIAQYRIGKLKLSFATFDDIGAMFISDGKHWVFHDPSFEKKLKRKLTPQLEKTSIKDLPSKKRTGR